MGSARRQRRFRAFRKQRAHDEELTRFGTLVLGVLGLEAVIFLFLTGALRPL